MIDIERMAQRAQAAVGPLSAASGEARNEALLRMAVELVAATPRLLAANEADVAAVREAGSSEHFVDRLKLNQSRIEWMAGALREVADCRARWAASTIYECAQMGCASVA